MYKKSKADGFALRALRLRRSKLLKNEEEQD